MRPKTEFTKIYLMLLCRSAVMPLCHYVVMSLCHYAVMPLCCYVVLSLCPYCELAFGGRICTVIQPLILLKERHTHALN